MTFEDNDSQANLPDTKYGSNLTTFGGSPEGLMMWQSGSPGQAVRGCDGDLGTWGRRTGSRFDSDAFQGESTRCSNWLSRGVVSSQTDREIG